MAAAERRQLTVVFIDIADSTALSERLDPEEFFSILRTYRDICDRLIRKYGGHIARTVGDGLLAYFGLPQAHQGDPEHAVHAGLAIAQAIGQHEFSTSDLPSIRLRVRIAVNTGLVVVGSLTGDTGVERRDVFGTPAHIAARLQSVAPPGSVIIGPSTHKLVQGAFQCARLADQEIKGMNDPIAVWRVDGVARTESRFEKTRTAPLTPMIGRESEVSVLVDLWRKTLSGHGSVVVISGEPGIGKSRMIRALRASLARYETLHFQCSPLHVNTPLAPVIERDRLQAGIEPNDAPEVMLGKLRALIGIATDDVEAAIPYYGALHSIPNCNGYVPADLRDPKHRERALQVSVDTVISLSRRRPILIIVEDVHWIDPTSIDLLKRLMASVERERVLLIITHRNNQDPYWLAGGKAVGLPLSKLNDRASEAMVRAVAGDVAVPQIVIRNIVGRSDGVPLFIEECTRSVLEAGLLWNEKGRNTVSSRLKEPAVPTSLHDLLMERLDRLGEAKWIAQVASIFGRHFDHTSLQHLLQMPKRKLASGLRQIEEAGLLYRQKRSPGSAFAFKHVMIQEAAYSSLLKEARAELHARAAAWLRIADGKSRSHPAVLAHHFTRAGMFAEAVAAWLESSKLALARSANREAIASLWQGIELTSKLPKSESRFQMELALQAHLAVAYTAMVGWAGAKVDLALTRALELCQSYGSAQEKAVVLWGAIQAAVVGSQLQKALSLANEFIELAEAWGNTEAILLANTGSLLANFFLGNLDRARDTGRRICRLYDRAAHGGIVNKCLHDPKILALSYLGHIQWVLGDPVASRAACQAARQLAREVAHPFMLAYALILGSSDHLYERDHAANLSCVEEGLRVAEENGIALYGSFARLWAVPSLVTRDPATLASLADLLATLLKNHYYLQAPLYQTFLAIEFARAGEFQRAGELTAAAETLMERTGEKWFEPEVYRVRGVLLSLAPDRRSDEATRYFETAITSARTRGMLGWELRAALSFAQFLRCEGQRSKARALLIEARDRYPPTATSADLAEADVLLAELGK
jgi:class 3 adenylate cyclase